MTGKRAGPRRAEKPPRASRSVVLSYAVAITVFMVAWGYLVFVAIDFGGSARAGRSTAWWLLAIASLGAVACLFVGLLLVTRLISALGPRPGAEDAAPALPRPAGGRRAAR